LGTREPLRPEDRLGRDRHRPLFCILHILDV
jgi:hypothetical protein